MEHRMCSTRARMRVAVVAVLSACSQVSAQERPCPKVQAVLGIAGYQARSGDARCEGFYQSPVAGASLELLSLTAGPVDYRLDQQSTLRIVVPDVARWSSAPVQVQARAVPLGTYYRMDATIPSAGSMNWPKDAVLIPAQLAPDMIGVVGWIEQDAGRIYVPVSVSEGPGPAPSGTLIVAILRAAVDLDDLRWRSLVGGDPARPPEWKRAQRSGRVLRAGQPIYLEFESGSERIVEVNAKAINSDTWFPFRLRMYGP
jgi:hypothetical protein